MEAERVSFFSGGVQLAGTLTIPDKVDRPGPAVVPGKPAVKGGQNLVTNRTAQAAEFYRLSSP